MTPRNRFGQLLSELSAQQLVGSSHRVQQPPDNKRPARTMPQAADEKRHQQPVHHRRLAPVPFADQDRGKQVVVEPRGQRDVPAAPVFGDRLADEGVVEVLHQLKAHHPRRAPGQCRCSRRSRSRSEKQKRRSPSTPQSLCGAQGRCRPCPRKWIAYRQ